MLALAAAYGFGIVKNRPFIDGNKRTGFACAVRFLVLNGQSFNASGRAAASEADAVVQTLGLAAGAVDGAGYVSRLKRQSRRA